MKKMVETEKSELKTRQTNLETKESKFKCLKSINWFAFASGILLAVVLYLSFSYPWWQFRIGDFVIANVTPFNTNFNVLGVSFLIPLLTAINISSLLLLSISTVVMIVYSVIPKKSYSKQLLCFAYKQPLYSVISFVVTLVVLAIAVPMLIGSFTPIQGLSIPLMGSSVIQLPTQMFGLPGVSIAFLVSGAFQWTFWLAVVACGFCVAARIYHRSAFKEAKAMAVLKTVSV